MKATFYLQGGAKHILSGDKDTLVDLVVLVTSGQHRYVSFQSPRKSISGDVLSTKSVYVLASAVVLIEVEE